MSKRNENRPGYKKTKVGWIPDQWHCVPIPSKEEQHAIVDVLQAADDEINQLETKLKAFEKQNRGLMQKLLTGEVRVK